MSCQGNTNKLVVMESNKPPNPEQEQEALGGYVYDNKRKAFVYCFFSKTNKVPGIVPANEDSIIVEKNLSVTESVVGLKGSVAVEKYKYAATHAMSSSCLGAQNNVLQRGTFDVHQVTPLTALWSKTLSSASSSDVPQQAQSLTSPKGVRQL